MATISSSASRLFVLLARKSDVAVILRRGPSKQVLLVRWHRNRDRFFFGQWLNGRIYERRCDLSPSGEHFLYFAANYKQPHYSWTAVSRPPFLTALALWPKGDCWGGGGQFKTENKILLNHRSGEMKLAESFRLPKAISVQPFGSHSGWGEDSPLCEATLQRQGWTLANAGKATEHSFTGPIWFTFDPPQTWAKPSPRSKSLVLRSMLTGYHRREGPNHVIEYNVAANGELIIDLGETEWADWDANGDLLYSQQGRLYRRRYKAKSFAEAICLLDTTDAAFRSLEPHSEATTWRKNLQLDESSDLSPNNGLGRARDG